MKMGWLMATAKPYTLGLTMCAISIFNLILTQMAFHKNGLRVTV